MRRAALLLALALGCTSKHDVLKPLAGEANAVVREALEAGMLTGKVKSDGEQEQRDFGAYVAQVESITATR